MEETITKLTQKYITPRIPDELVYEKINGRPVYYKGYNEVIKQQKQIEEIMGCSDMQAIIIDLILQLLYKNINLKKYKILSNEIGLHLNKKNNLAADISIFEKEKIIKRGIHGTYIEIPPQVIIEIDTKADLNDFDNVMDYYQVKTEKLFNFGVKKVFWILTKNKQIIEAIPNEPWLIKKWNYDINIIDNIILNLENSLKEDGVFEIIK